MASWSSPQVNGIGVMIFFSGAPVYVIAKLMAKLKCTNDLCGKKIVTHSDYYFSKNK